MDKAAESKIKTYKKYISEAEKNLKDAEKDMNFASYKIAKNGQLLPHDIKNFINIELVAKDPAATPEAKANANFQITTWTSMYPDLHLLGTPCLDYSTAKYEIEKYTAEIAKIEAEQKKLEAKVEETVEEEKAEPEQKGHLYPVRKVTEWTNTLNHWNKVLDDTIKKIDEMDPLKVDITWLMKKCEWICRKINYALAVLRYEIIKCLHQVYQQVQDFLPLIDVIVNWAPSANPGDLLKPILGVIDLFMKPYKVALTFLQDFVTYTPPLVEAAAKLPIKAAMIPAKLLTKIDFVAQDQNGEKKELVEVYKDYINIKMEPITLGDIVTGNVEKPAIAQFTGNKKQYELLKAKYETAYLDICTWSGNFVKLFEDNYKDSLPQLSVRSPIKCNSIDQGLSYFIANTNQEVEDYAAAFIAYELKKEQEKAEKADKKAVEKAQKAQKLAERNQILAAKDILNDEHIAQAEQAKAEADKALQEAKVTKTEVATPWRTRFNNNRHVIYPIHTTKTIVNNIDQYLDRVQVFYEETYAKNNSSPKLMAEGAKVVSFVKAFSPAYPFIEEELNKLKDLVITMYKAKYDMSDLNKRSIFK